MHSIQGQKSVKRKQVDQHPLSKDETSKKAHGEKAKSISKGNGRSLIDNPLISSFEGVDPLGVTGPICQSYKTSTNRNAKLEEETTEDLSETTASWKELRHTIFQRHAYKHHFQTVSGYLESSKTDPSQMSSLLDKSKLGSIPESERLEVRLQSLNLVPELKKSSSRNINQDKFIEKMVTLKSEIIEAWKTSQLVKALKSVMQCAKELALTCPEDFYSCKFVFITDILNCFGNLVYTRLIQISKQGSPFGSANNSLEAEDTAQNWLAKVASIRELLPRIYLEASIIRSYSFLSSGDDCSISKRLLQMARGLGDPIVSTYCRLFIIQNSMMAGFCNSSVIATAISDTVNAVEWGWSGQGIFCDKDYANEALDMNSANLLFKPPFLYFAKLLVQYESGKKLEETLNLVQPVSTYAYSKYLLLSALLEAFPVSLLRSHFADIDTCLRLSFSKGVPACDTLISLGRLSETSLFQEDLRTTLHILLNLTNYLKNPAEYIKVWIPWMQAGAKIFTITGQTQGDDFGTILHNFLFCFNSLVLISNDMCYPELLEMIRVIVTTVHSTKYLFRLIDFAECLRYFESESASNRVVVRIKKSNHGVTEIKKLLELILEHHTHDFDQIPLVELLLGLFASLHDGINALTIDDERRQITSLITEFIRKVNFGRHLERQLNFYVDARASFSSLDSVLEFLIQQVCRLQKKSCQIAGSKYRSSSFQNAATSYCFITIPSLASSVSRLKLYTFCGGIAIGNDCIGQGTSCYMSSISELPEISNDIQQGIIDENSPDVTGHIFALLSHLIAVPCVNDTEDPCYLFKAFVKALDSFTAFPLLLLKLCSGTISALKVCRRPVFPYHFKGEFPVHAVANDTLFNVAVRKKYADKLITKILNAMLTIINNNDDYLSSLEVSASLEVVISNANLEDATSKNIIESFLKKTRKKQSNAKIRILEKLYLEAISGI